MIKIRIKHTLFIISLVLSLLLNSVFAYAQGEAVPYSSGDKPLNYDYCALEDGTKIQSGQEINTLQPKFTLKFDKNIVNMLVWENNRKCVSMTTDNNENVVVDVSKVDDTVDFDHRQEIFVQPINPLQSGKTYYIKVGPQLIAKNKISTLGGTTGQGITIAFKTKKQEVSQSSNTSSSANQNASQSSAVNSLNQSQSNQNAAGTAATNKTAGLTTNDNYSNLWLYVIIGVLIIGWIVFEIFVKRKMKKEERSNKPLV